ncbi:hypothetical protein B0O99DRAFT_708331 [Bisporella sp. PMI_857]|nr:hypothetical protein B0O99DRAFT_708331 [Bisporella sp. PMI_857]
MVLADGRHITSSLTENTGLFWVIRGAGHNFGVATEFTYQVYEIPEKIWCGAVTMSYDQLPAIIDFTANISYTTFMVYEMNTLYGNTIATTFAAACVVLLQRVSVQHNKIMVSEIPLFCTKRRKVVYEIFAVDFFNKFPSRNDGTASMNLTIAGPPANVTASTLLYHGSGADAKKFFAELLALPQIANTCKECPYTAANTIITPRVPWGSIAYTTRNEADDRLCRKWVAKMATKLDKEFESSAAKTTGIGLKAGSTYANYDGETAKDKSLNLQKNSHASRSSAPS